MTPCLLGSVGCTDSVAYMYAVCVHVVYVHVCSVCSVFSLAHSSHDNRRLLTPSKCVCVCVCVCV